MMPMVSAFADGMSTQRISMPASFNPSRKCALRARRSSRATTRAAPWMRQAAIAFRSSGRSFFLPLSTSTNSPTTCHRSPLRKFTTEFLWAAMPSPDSPCRVVETRRYDTHFRLLVTLPSLNVSRYRRFRTGNRSHQGIKPSRLKDGIQLVDTQPTVRRERPSWDIPEGFLTLPECPRRRENIFY